MNTYVLVLAMVLASSNALVYGGEHEDYPYSLKYYANTKLGAFLEKFKTIMKEGNETLKIPILDPFKLDQKAINIKEKLVTLDALLTNLKAEGLSAYTVNSADFTPAGLKVNLSLTWPLIQAETGYAMKGNAIDTIPIFGVGTIKVVAENLYFAGNLKFSIKSGKLHVKNMSSAVSLGSLKLKITGLYDDEEISELLSAVISEMTPQLIQDYQDVVTLMLNKIASEKVNEFLATKSLMEWISLLG